MSELKRSTQPTAEQRVSWSLRMAMSLVISGVVVMATHAETAPMPAQVTRIPDNGNLPLNSAVFTGSRDYGDFARWGYVEEEFYISGKASTRDQETSEILKADLPYTSRIIVRRPLNPKAFSGNVVIEPLHGLLEKAEMWEQTHDYMTRNGDIWVGVTVKAYGIDMDPKGPYSLGGIPLLKAYDAERYAPLQLEPDMRPLAPAPPAPTPPQGIELMMQVSMLFKSNDEKSPIKKLYPVKRVFMVGGGINGEIVTGFVRNKLDEKYRLADGKKIVDGYFSAVNNRFIDQPPKDAAYAMFHSENEVLLEANLGYTAKNPDTPSFKIYAVPGTPHIGSRNSNPSSHVQVNWVLPKPELNMPYQMDNPPCPNENDDPVDLFMSAILARIEEYAVKGTPLPAAPLPEVVAADPGATLGSKSGGGMGAGKRVSTLKRDQISGNVIGGVRLPWLEAPIAHYMVPEDMFTKSFMGPPPGADKPPAGGPPANLAVSSGDVIHGIAAGAMLPKAAPVLHPTDSWTRASKESAKFARPNGFAFCAIITPRIPYDKDTLHKLYKNYDDYVAKFERAKANAVKAGWILKEDAATLRPRGNPEDF